MHHLADGIKLYGSYRIFFSEKRPSSFYGQVNLGGGYFSQSVTYVANLFNNEDNYPIYRQKQFLAIGGNMQLGYHLMINWISFPEFRGFFVLKTQAPQIE